MFVRVVNIKFSSKIEADAMHALAKHEMINKLPGILSIEVISISELHSIAINKFDNKESADKSKEVYINNMKSNPNIKVEIFEGDRSFIVEKS
tara:strand:+ start:649 stop:927 length:279 start_codon:yes stop_codon:yes gene_type:complete